MGSSGSSYIDRAKSGATWAAVGEAVATVSTGGMSSALVAGYSAIDTGALVGGVVGAVNAPSSETNAPNAEQPAETRQSKDNGHGGAAYSMQLSQQLAASAAGTLFSTPTQWMGQQVGNDPNTPRKTLVGA